MARAFMLEDGTTVVGFGRNGIYLPDDSTPEKYPGYYRERTRPGVAWRIVGDEIEFYEDDSDPEFEPCEAWRETGRVVAVMVGDDKRFAFDPDDLEPIDEDAFCAECGQIGCTADGRERA